MAKGTRDTFRRKDGSDTFRRKVRQGESEAQTPIAVTPSLKGKAYEKVLFVAPPASPSLGYTPVTRRLHKAV